ncbi:hypothetical protein AAP_05864 [Ascosphaera apis ARSEF 7405]|uniref:Uncharacterized protein n=1 Tax=Ascosphaera apis ARSEF 7405 TaxID=392613 RepID=A0A167V9B4_9EURO|nr:hypothetical protein AAP_05864 [Ascosphaera apis ARSEF 7405]
MPSPHIAKEQARKWALYHINHRDPKPGYYQNGQKINLEELSETELRFMIMTGEVTTAMLEDLKSTNRGRQFMQWIERGRVAASKRLSLTDESVKNGVRVSVAALDHRDGDGEDQGDNGDQGVVALPSPLSST